MSFIHAFYFFKHAPCQMSRIVTCMSFLGDFLCLKIGEQFGTPNEANYGPAVRRGKGNREPTSMTDFCFLHRKRVAKRGTCSSFIQMNVNSWKKFWGASDCGVRTSGQKMTFIFFRKMENYWRMRFSCVCNWRILLVQQSCS